MSVTSVSNNNKCIQTYTWFRRDDGGGGGTSNNVYDSDGGSGDDDDGIVVGFRAHVFDFAYEQFSFTSRTIYTRLTCIFMYWAWAVGTLPSSLCKAFNILQILILFRALYSQVSFVSDNRFKQQATSNLENYYIRAQLNDHRLFSSFFEIHSWRQLLVLKFAQK